MKTKQEIQEMIEKCRELRKYIPSHSMFGDDNHGSLDTQIRILTMCLDKDWDELDIDEKTKDRVEILGDDWSDDPEVNAYDWLTDKGDDLADDDSIAVFKKKAQKESANQEPSGGKA